MSLNTRAGAFNGFPTRGSFTPVHNLFFTGVLPDIQDIAELKVTLHILWALYLKKGYPRFVTPTELLADATLVQSLGGKPDVSAILASALDAATRRGTLLRTRVNPEGGDQELFFLNTEADRRAIGRLVESPNASSVLVIPTKPPAELPDRRNIFSLYEAHIGMLTPMIAEELKEAETSYPPEWVEDAFREAVELNKRSWRYISRILERWSAEGKPDGKHERITQKTDPDKYIRGKYGHVVKRH
jgi:DNA replication protein